MRTQVPRYLILNLILPDHVCVQVDEAKAMRLDAQPEGVAGPDFIKVIRNNIGRDCGYNRQVGVLETSSLEATNVHTPFDGLEWLDGLTSESQERSCSRQMTMVVHSADAFLETLLFPLCIVQSP